ncbi:MAG: VCBS repeat-containing protein [Planctomycetes bacterium]|nr:VCBS repeat-containing protein [Planctomycetota bacterium]
MFFEDLNFDGLIDCVVTYEHSNTILYAFGDLISTLSVKQDNVIEFEDQVISTVLVDTNGDGKKDLVVVTSDKLEVSLSVGGNKFEQTPSISLDIGFKGTSAMAWDYDKNGTNDFLIVVGHSNVNPNQGLITAYHIRLSSTSQQIALVNLPGKPVEVKASSSS